MSYNNDVMGAALDRHITGNWGEDQFAGEEDFEQFIENTCPSCVFNLRNDCSMCERYFDGENNIEECLVIKAHIEEQLRLEREMDKDYREMEEERLREEQMDMKAMMEE
jgi:hypothetical protein